MTLDHPFIMGQYKGFLHYYTQNTIIALDPVLPSVGAWLFEIQRQNRIAMQLFQVQTMNSNYKVSFFNKSLNPTWKILPNKSIHSL